MVLEPYECEGGPPFYGVEDEVEFLVRHSGNDAYKSFMRQKLVHHPMINEGRDQVNQFQRRFDDECGDSRDAETTTATERLSFLFGSSTDREGVLSTFSNLKQSLNQALNRDVGEEYVLVSYPMYLPDSARNLLRNVMKEAGFMTLSMQPLPIIATMSKFHTASGDDTVLWIELGGAAFEMALLEVDSGVAEALAYEADTDLGEDMIALKILEQESNGTFINHLSPTAFANTKSDLTKLQRDHHHQARATGSSNVDSSHHSTLAQLRHERSLLLERALERFMTSAVQQWPRLAGRPPSRMQITSPGDPSWSDFATLNNAVLSAAKSSDFYPSVAIIDGDAHPWHRASRHTALWGEAWAMLGVPQKPHHKGRDDADWYERRCEAVARYRCELRGGKHLGRYPTG